MAAERLQKILAHAGVASRRTAEELIEAGHVSVNGKVVRELGSKADLAQDVIRVDGRTLRETQDKVYYVLYKPAGCVTTLSDPEQRATIKTYLEDIHERVYPVGRLDYDAEGALVVTNDGDLAYSMMHPKFGVRRTYLAKVHGVPSPEQIERARSDTCEPVELELHEDRCRRLLCRGGQPLADDAQHPAAHAQAPRDQLPRVAPVRPDQPQPRERPTRLVEDQLRPIPVLNSPFRSARQVQKSLHPVT